jgi:hypothetical protein
MVATYNHAVHVVQRKEMMQTSAEMWDGLSKKQPA